MRRHLTDHPPLSVYVVFKCPLTDSFVKFFSQNVLYQDFIKFLRNILLEAYYLAQDVYSAIKVAEFQAFVMVAVKNPFMRDRLREERFSNSC